jgi:hypothetical protein
MLRKITPTKIKRCGAGGTVVTSDGGLTSVVASMSSVEVRVRGDLSTVTIEEPEGVEVRSREEEDR